MLVLGSTYLPMMDGISARTAPGIEVRAFNLQRTLVEQIGDVDVLILGHQRVAQAELAAAPRLRLIQQHGRGVDGVDIAAARRCGVAVANVPGGNSVAVAEHSLALLLTLAKQLHRVPASIARRQTGQPMGIELRGKTMGLVGLGASGRELAAIARALGMRVLAIRGDPGKGMSTPVDFLGGPERLDHVLAESDFVVLLTTLNPGTDGMMGRNQLAAMKQTAFLVNTGRARLVDRAALHAALRSRDIAGAAFDVFWEEPADPADPLLALENFVLTPHVAGFSDVAIETISTAVAGNIHRLRDGVALANLISI